MTYLWKAIKKGFGVYLPRIREGMFLHDMKAAFAPPTCKTMRTTGWT